MNRTFIIVILIAISISADATYNKNKKANKLYEKGKHAEALSLYEEALIEDPDEKKLSINKGSAQYRLNDFSGAEESYKNAITVEDTKARADLFYNRGNIYNIQGDQMAQTGNQQAMEKYKAARNSYIKSLDLRSHDKDAKWNLQLTQMKIKELEKQQQQQQQKQDNKDRNKQNQDKQNQDKQQDKKDKQKKEQEEEEKKDRQQQQKPEDQQQEQKPQPKPQKSEEDMEKEEAMRLLRQYADDDKELNKPRKKMRALMGKKPEKDW